MTLSPPVAPEVGRKAALVFARWMEARGVPYEVLFPPSHLANYACALSDPAIWSALTVQQNDEKDMQPARGLKGLCDLGDGACQRIVAEHCAAVAAVEAEEAALRKLPAADAMAQPAFAQTASVVREQLATLKVYDAKATGEVERLRARVKELEARQRKRTTLQKERERLARKVGDLNVLIGEVDSLHRRVMHLSHTLGTTFGRGVAPPDHAKAAGLAKDLKELLSEAFNLAHRPASKALAVMCCSVFDCSDKALSALYFTPDNLKTWQLREAIVRNALDMYSKGMITLAIGADKAFATAADWDLDGFPKTVTAAKRDVEELTRLIPDQTGMVTVPVAKWRRLRDVRAAAEQLLTHPLAIAAGIQRVEWMDAKVESRSIDRWRAFLQQWDITHIQVQIIGFDHLGTRSAHPSVWSRPGLCSQLVWLRCRAWQASLGTRSWTPR